MRCQLDVPEQMSKRQLVCLGLEFRGGVLVGDLNLGVTGLEVELKFMRKGNPDK